MRRNVNMTSEELNLKSSKTKMINVSEEQEIQIFAKQMLSKRIFVGHYQERRYVDSLNDYRDIVRLSDAEEELCKDLSIVKKRIQPFYPPHLIWTGVTGPDLPGAPAGFCLWVNLTDLPFGHYWFQIREVKFLENEVIIRLKYMRSYAPENILLTSRASAEANEEPSESRENSQGDTSHHLQPFEFKHVIDTMKNIKYDELITSCLSSFKVCFTLTNAKETTRFLVLLVVSAVTLFCNFIMFVGDFSIRLLRELSILIRACTPIFLGIIDFFSKCVGGFYILIAMIWRGSPPNFPPQNRPSQLALKNIPHTSASSKFRQPYQGTRFSQYR